MESDCETPEDAVIRQERILAVRTAISQLNDDHKSIIILRDIQGLSYEEVSEILNISLGTVKSRLSRARSALKEQIISNDRL
jgi:RNA polymerase sigma-70 factor (ECF subfamily)